METHGDTTNLTTGPDLMTNNDFDGYYSRYHTYVRSSLRKRFRRLQHADLEDLEQTIWLRVFRYNGLINKPEMFVSWIHRVVTNVTLDHLRSRRRRHQDDAVEFTDHNTPTINPIGTANLELTQALQRLNPKYRTIVEFRVLGGYSTSDTATYMDLDRNIVRVRHHRAMTMLRKQHTATR